MASEALISIWKEWIVLHSKLCAHAQDEGSVMPSAPLISSDSDCSSSKHKLLYIGQATRGGWCDDDFLEGVNTKKPIADLIVEFEENNRHFVRNDRGKFSFWKTLRDTSYLLGNEEGHSNCLYSNLAKIGLPKCNPVGFYLKDQLKLAALTLRVEIEEYRPTIVFFATGRFGSKIVLDGTGIVEDKWHKSDNYPSVAKIDNEIWWVPRSMDLDRPAFLWTMHPRQGSCIQRAFWASAALQLSLGKSDIVH